MALWQWSKTATANATADPTINWAEGMPPSVVNDSARATMARIAEWRDDISCSLTTGGSASAYTLTTNEGLATPTPTTGQLIGFVASATNNQGATLAVDGGSVYPLQSQSGQTIPAGVLISGSPYTAMFNGTAWLLRNFYGNPFNTPIGGLMPYLGSSAPNSNFVLPFAQAISRTTYATLFALIGTTFGVGDGSTTFNLPDLRGRAIFGQDNMGGSAAGRITVAGGNFDGTVLGNTGGAQNQTLAQNQLPNIVPTFSGTPRTWNLNGTVMITPQTGGGVYNPGSNSFVIGTPTVTVTPDGTISSINGNVTQQAHPILSPAMTLPFILRVI